MDFHIQLTNNQLIKLYFKSKKTFKKNSFFWFCDYLEPAIT